MISYFLERIHETPQTEAIVSDKFSVSYGQISEKVDGYFSWIRQNNIPQGAVVSFDGDYSPAAVSLFLALIKNKNIIVPLSMDSRHHFEEFREIASTEIDISIDGDNLAKIQTGREANYALYDELRAKNAPGLVLFSSGSTGKSKAIVQDLNKLMEKFKTPRKALRMLIFLQLDHIGGINSLLYTLSNQGTIIVADSKSPEIICSTIEKYKAELLPTSPTFLNLLILSGVHKKYDISSLNLITYGTEPMQESTLAKLTNILPNIKLQQTYGLSEVGILRSKSRSSGSLWMKVGGEDIDIKIIDNILWIKSNSSMLGYLNAPSPFDKDGFMNTEDEVELDGDWIRILGRKSEIINIGGYKVFPAEVESVLLAMSNVEDVAVYGATHQITGNIVTAKIKLTEEESLREFKGRMLTHCKDRLQAYKVPSKVIITEESIYNERYKRIRRTNKTIVQ